MSGAVIYTVETAARFFDPLWVSVDIREMIYPIAIFKYMKRSATEITEDTERIVISVAIHLNE